MSFQAIISAHHLSVLMTSKDNGFREGAGVLSTSLWFLLRIRDKPSSAQTYQIQKVFE